MRCRRLVAFDIHHHGQTRTVPRSRNRYRLLARYCRRARRIQLRHASLRTTRVRLLRRQALLPLHHTPRPNHRRLVCHRHQTGGRANHQRTRLANHAADQLWLAGRIAVRRQIRHAPTVQHTLALRHRHPRCRTQNVHRQTQKLERRSVAETHRLDQHRPKPNNRHARQNQR